MKQGSQTHVAASQKSVFIVEDHAVFREGLVQILKNSGDLSVCGQAGTVAQALPAIARLEPDLVLVDITLPGKSGLQLIKEVRSSNTEIKLLVISMHDEALYADRVLRAGGDGYIMKQEDPEEIIRAIRDVLAGRIYVSEQVLTGTPKAAPKRTQADGAGRPLDLLADEELEILELLGQGKSNQEISTQLRLSARAVADQCAQIKRKLDVKTDNALIRYAVCWLEKGAA